MKKKIDEKLYDAIAVNMNTRIVRIFGAKKTLPNAEAISSAMAVIPRGCEEYFYAEVPTGTYKDGDKWKE